MSYEKFEVGEKRMFSFMKIPKDLFAKEEFKQLSSDAKLLYSLMLDRMQLSEQNHMYDEDGKTFIYLTIEEIMKITNWTRYKTLKVLDSLDDKKGIGLIKRRRTGLGKPNMIYVMDFRKSGLLEDRTSTKIEHMKLDELTSESVNIGFQDICQTNSNNTYINNTDKSNTDLERGHRKDNKQPYGRFKNVFLTCEEMIELTSKYPYDGKDMVEKLSAYMESTGKTYQNHFATIISWIQKDGKKQRKRNYSFPPGASL